MARGLMTEDPMGLAKLLAREIPRSTDETMVRPSNGSWQSIES